MFSDGQQIGRYKIRSAIGKGGMGEVFLADDIELERLVALKVLPVDVANDSERLRRFAQEAKAVSALNHPNIITIHEIGKTDNTHFIATEYIEGETLHSRLRSERMNLKSVLDVAIQVASALDAAHRAGIVHRDIKPENVMIRPDAVVKILDFGIAKLIEKRPDKIDEEAATAIKAGTQAGMIIGTASYMSPEQAKGKPVDARSDIFSFGVVLYEMLAGKQPFDGENALDVIGSILNKEPVSLSQLAPDIPRELQRIVEKSLRKDREERYQTAKDLLIDLKDVRQDLEIQNKLERTAAPNREEPKTQILGATTSDAAHTTSSAEYITNEIKSHKSSFIIGLVVLLLASISFGYWFFTSHSLSAKGQIESIAVLPFINESGNADNEYLSDGITESLINSLSQLPNMKVIARSSVFHYKGKETDVQKIAAELNVLAVMTGRIIQRGETLDISVNLTDVQNNTQLWGQRYKRKISDIFAVQDEIAKQVVDSLRVKLTGAEQMKLTKRYTDNEEAYKLYLQGRYQWNQRTGESLKKAEEFYKQAIEKDPNFALAYAGLAETYALFSKFSVVSAQDSMPQARALTMKALELDDSLAEAHNALAFYLHAFDWNQPASEREFRRAIELNPNYATAHHWLSQGPLIVTQKFEEALTEARRAEELDPLSTIIRTDTGVVLYWMKRFDEAIAQYKHTIAIDPNFYYAHWSLGAAYHQKGMYAESIAEYKKALQLKDDSWVIGLLACSLAKNGQRNAALKLIEQLKAQSSHRYVASYSIAIAYTALDEKDQAFFWLEKDFAEHSSSAPNYFQDFFLEDLRDDPRFQDLLRRVGFRA
jgi:serine/threonine-protein kinase